MKDIPIFLNCLFVLVIVIKGSGKLRPHINQRRVGLECLGEMLLRTLKIFLLEGDFALASFIAGRHFTRLCQSAA